MTDGINAWAFAFGGESIEGALIRTDDNASAISLQDGTYLIVHRAGTFTVIAEASGYTSLSYSGVIINKNETMTKDFGLVSLDGGDDSGGDAEDGEDQGEQDGEDDGEDSGEGGGGEEGGGSDDGEDQSDGSGTPAASSSGDTGGSCFIATAAYGSAMEPFRDRFMLANTVGKAFVHFYYIYSPPVADFIAIHDTLRAVVRWSLLPVVGVSWMALNSGPWVTMVVVVLLICLTYAGTRFVLRRMQFRDQI